ncbi:hypothetical protein HAX54_040131 [Datura stramonium]|uniref:Uncharacterized protein n=1 Tax=Datura stramonium TaxID=4076 RepID=A0ABS8VP09_DATST|nr:hypothetical protein [Datura stramonium]
MGHIRVSKPMEMTHQPTLRDTLWSAQTTAVLSALNTTANAYKGARERFSYSHSGSAFSPTNGSLFQVKPCVIAAPSNHESTLQRYITPGLLSGIRAGVGPVVANLSDAESCRGQPGRRHVTPDLFLGKSHIGWEPMVVGQTSTRTPKSYGVTTGRRYVTPGLLPQTLHRGIRAGAWPVVGQTQRGCFLSPHGVTRTAIRNAWFTRQILYRLGGERRSRAGPVVGKPHEDARVLRGITRDGDTEPFKIVRGEPQNAQFLQVVVLAVIVVLEPVPAGGGGKPQRGRLVPTGYTKDDDTRILNHEGAREPVRTISAAVVWAVTVVSEPVPGRWLGKLMRTLSPWGNQG